MSFIKKILQKIFMKSPETLVDITPSSILQKGKHLIPEEENSEVTFINNFKKTGGLFFYAENKEEVVGYIWNILTNEDISEVLCMDPNLINILNTLDCNHSDILSDSQDIALLNCEYLLAINGAVMVSSDQMFQCKSNQLPNKIVIIASTNQIVKSAQDGLANLRFKKRYAFPYNITSLHGGK